MTRNIKKTLLLLSAVVASLIDRLDAQKPNSTIGCFVAGECVNGTAIGLIAADSISKCVDFSGTLEGSNYFSYSPEDNLCLVLAECPQLSLEACPNCISGDATCSSEICNYEGN